VSIEHSQEDLTRFINTYSNLNKESIACLDDLYHQHIVFEDPAHRIEGLDQLKDYFSSMYENLFYCHFEIESADWIQGKAYLKWTMRFSHPKLKNGHEIRVPGMTFIEFEQGKVRFHRDYFDLGAMIYQHVPVLGMAVRLLKRKLGQ
jgi:hypothetical protein